MLRSFEGARGAEALRKRQAGDVELVALTTAVPANTINQDEVRDEAAPYLAGMEHMLSTFGNAGVHHRHMVKPVSWYLESHDWVERTAVFQEAALELLVQATESCLAEARMAPSEIDAVVLVTSTGISIPSLDAALANHLGFKSSVERTPIFGLGCAGGATGLARAAQLVEANPDFVVLLLVVEICSANLSLLNVSKTDAVAFTLFGDGASAVLLRRGGSRKPAHIARYVTSGEHLWPDTGNLAGITVRKDSLGLRLSPALVAFVRKNLGPAVDLFLRNRDLALDDFAGFVFHAGASKMIEAAAESLGVDMDSFDSSSAVLRDYGNLSACSVLFVLERALRTGATGRHLMGALGPGFTLSLVVLDL